MTVPIAEASRFGIMNTDEEGRITEFEEKPKVPRSNKASMGIYIFNWSILKKFLAEDVANPDSSNDFGKNVIPAMIDSGCRHVCMELFRILEGCRNDCKPLGGKHGFARHKSCFQSVR